MSRLTQTLLEFFMPKANRGLRRGGTNSLSLRRNQLMQQRYDSLVAEMKRDYDVRVRKWRNSTTGCAWELRYHSGGTARLIESPYPRGPVSCAVFLHEIGHHAIGLGRYRPRCLEEYHAWQWALEAMQSRGFRITPSVHKRMTESLKYAMRKATRRGLTRIPHELEPYL